MSSLGDRFKKFAGKTRYVVCRLFLHLYGQEIAPMIGILNRAGREAIDSEGDLEVMGEGLSLIHISSPRDGLLSRMPSSA